MTACVIVVCCAEDCRPWTRLPLVTSGECPDDGHICRLTLMAEVSFQTVTPLHIRCDLCLIYVSSVLNICSYNGFRALLIILFFFKKKSLTANNNGYTEVIVLCSSRLYACQAKPFVLALFFSRHWRFFFPSTV